MVVLEVQQRLSEAHNGNGRFASDLCLSLRRCSLERATFPRQPAPSQASQHAVQSRCLTKACRSKGADACSLREALVCWCTYPLRHTCPVHGPLTLLLTR